MADRQCELGVHTWSTGRRTRKPCPRPAAWLYTNGDMRRLECQEHGDATREMIRYYSDDPREPKITRLKNASEDADGDCTHDGEVHLYTLVDGEKTVQTVTCAQCGAEIQQTAFEDQATSEQPAAGDREG